MASEIVTFGATEGAAVAWLNAHLGGVHASTRVPADRPAELVKVTRTGGSDLNLVTELVQLTFECWAADEVRASEICRQVKALVRAMAGETVTGIFIRSVRTVGGVVDFPDPESTSPRYQYTAELNCRYLSVGDA